MTTISEQFKKVQPIVEEHTNPHAVIADVKHVGNSFRVQSNAINDSNESTLKTRGAFKIRVQNKGTVDVKLFGNFALPSYADEVFETGENTLGFDTDTPIEYAPHSSSDVINIVLTAYRRV